jgi:hypothetical protein
VQEAEREDHRSPVRVFHFFQEVLCDESREGLIEPCFEALRRLVGYLDSFLEESERELRVCFTGDPEAEVLV